jgi:hypothetical protein
MAIPTAAGIAQSATKGSESLIEKDFRNKKIMERMCNQGL